MDKFRKIVSNLFGTAVLTDERRDVIRMSCRLKLDVRQGPKIIEGMASNLSLKGARLETRESLKKGTKVILAQPDSTSGPVNCLVVWSHRVGESWSSGVTYSDSDDNKATSWLKDVLEQMGFRSGKIRERRIHLRMNTSLRANLLNRSGDTLSEGKLNNISTGGAQLTVEVEMPSGIGVRLAVDPTLQTPPLDVQAIIKSSRKDTKTMRWVLGLKFDFTGEPQVLKMMRALQKARPN